LGREKPGRVQCGMRYADGSRVDDSQARKQRMFQRFPISRKGRC